MAGWLALAAVALAATGRAEARDLTVALRAEMDEAARAALLDAVVTPFAAAGGTSVQTTGHGPGAPVPQDGGPAWDVLQLTASDLLSMCAAGALEKLDWGALGGRDRVLPRAASDCGTGAVLRATVLAWDRDKFQATPTWTDFGDIAKNPGKRGIMRSVVGTLEIALLADGVAPADIYTTLRGGDGVERAFRKLDQLKPYLVFWSRDGDKPVAATTILGSGEVLMTSAPADLVVQANRTDHRNFGLQWAGNLSSLDSWAIAKGSPNLAAAQQFLAFSGDPKLQPRLLVAGAYGSAARNAADGLPPELLAIDPAAPASLAASVPFDAGFWHDNIDKLRARFEAWLAH